MTTTAEESFVLLKKYQEIWESAIGANEATTRLRAIDVILFDVLKWDRRDCEAEKYCKKTGYLDYAMLVAKKPRLIIEAKKEGKTFKIPTRTGDFRPQPFGLLAAESKTTADALDQAIGYAFRIGCPMAAITNGFQWLITCTFIQDCDLDERLVCGFDLTNFTVFRNFFDTFSPKAIQSNSASAIMLQSRMAAAPRKLSADIQNYPRPAERNQIKNDLTAIISTVWHSIRTNENEEEFLQNCYVEPESSSADIDFAREILSETLSADEQRSASASDPSHIPHLYNSEATRRPIVVLGRVGHGKTTLINYLRLVRARKELDQYIQIWLNLNEQPQIAQEVSPYVLRLIDEQLYKRYNVDSEADNIARGALYIELERFKTSTEAKSYKHDPVALAEAETNRIINIRKDRFLYIGKVIHHLRAGRNRPVAIFFDNLDRKHVDIQEAAFKLASAIAHDWNCLVFICLRPETFRESRSEGVLDTVAPKTISVARPNIAQVLRKRLEFALSLVSDVRAKTLFSASIEVDVPSARDFFECSLESFGKNGKLVDLVRATANGNVRNILVHIEDILTSNHLDTGKILANYRADGYTIPIHEAQRALLLGDSIDYNPSESPFPNIFDIKKADPLEHFISFLALRYLSEVAPGASGRRLARTGDVLGFLISLGFQESVVCEKLELLADYKCVEGDIPEELWRTADSKVRVSEKGSYLSQVLCLSFVYYDLVACDTPILDEPLRREIRDEKILKHRIIRCGKLLEYLDTCSDQLHDAKAQSWWKDSLSATRLNIGKVKSNAAKRGML